MISGDSGLTCSSVLEVYIHDSVLQQRLRSVGFCALFPDVINWCQPRTFNGVGLQKSQAWHQLTIVRRIRPQHGSLQH